MPAVNRYRTALRSASQLVGQALEVGEGEGQREEGVEQQVGFGQEEDDDREEEVGGVEENHGSPLTRYRAGSERPPPGGRFSLR